MDLEHDLTDQCAKAEVQAWLQQTAAHTRPSTATPIKYTIERFGFEETAGCFTGLIPGYVPMRAAANAVEVASTSWKEAGIQAAAASGGICYEAASLAPFAFLGEDACIVATLSSIALCARLLLSPHMAWRLNERKWKVFFEHEPRYR